MFSFLKTRFKKGPVRQLTTRNLAFVSEIHFLLSHALFICSYGRLSKYNILIKLPEFFCLQLHVESACARRKYTMTDHLFPIFFLYLIDFRSLKLRERKVNTAFNAINTIHYLYYLLLTQLIICIYYQEIP